MRRRPLPSLRGEDGFTVVEIMIAGVLLTIGMLSTLVVMDGADRATASSRAREAATSLARELTERTRGLAFNDLTAATVTTKLQATAGLASTSAGSWTVSRRGVTYTITPEVCALDDISDGYGVRTSASCPGQPAGGTEDPQPDDFKRVGFRVSWPFGSGVRRSSHSVVRTSRSAADAPRVLKVTTASPTMPDPNAPVITSSAVTTLGLAVQAVSTAQTVTVSIDGVDVGTATPVGNGRDWTFNLNLVPIPDGTYDVGARATDVLGVIGPTVTMPLVLARAAPGAPQGLLGGRNLVARTVGGTQSRVPVIELDWLPPTERNVVGYRTYRADGTLACPGAMTTEDLRTSCVDFSPLGGSVTYQVAPLYRDASGTLREGPRASQAIQPGVGPAYVFRNTTDPAYSNTTCGNTNRLRDMVIDHPGDAGVAENPDNFRFCSPLFPTATTVPVGAVRVHVFADNRAANQDCSVEVVVSLGSQALFSTFVMFPRNSFSPVERVAEWTIGSPLSLAANQQYSVHYKGANGGGCNDSKFYFSGRTYRSRLQVSGLGINPPAAPTGLTATRAADGSVALSWTASTAPGITSYRVYRNGEEVGHRLERTGDARTTAIDPNRDGGTHTYRVTAVTDSLAESLPSTPATG